MKHIINGLAAIVFAMSVMLLILYLSGCGTNMSLYRWVDTGPSPYTTKEFSREEILDVVQYTIDELKIGSFNTEYGIILMDNWIVLKDMLGNYNIADGFTTYRGNKAIYVFAYQQCLADSALIHEVAHTLGYEHGDPEFEAAIKEVERNAIKDLCPEGYTSGPRPDISLLKLK